jgi:hypothetical protein
MYQQAVMWRSIEGGVGNLGGELPRYSDTICAALLVVSAERTVTLLPAEGTVLPLSSSRTSHVVRAVFDCTADS